MKTERFLKIQKAIVRNDSPKILSKSLYVRILNKGGYKILWLSLANCWDVNKCLA